MGFTLLPCAKDVCQECAIKHDWEQPHNADSLYYQYKFYGDNGRWPTWFDALSHCPQPVKDHWIRELKARGIWKREWELPAAQVPEVMPTNQPTIGSVTTITAKPRKRKDSRNV